MENDILDSLTDIGYQGPLTDEVAFAKALDGGLKSLEFTKLIHIVAEELKTLCGLEETVNLMNSADESSAFLLELSCFLKELKCPYKCLVIGHMSSRLQSKEDRLLLLDYLISELMAARMVQVDNPQEKKGSRMEIVVQESPTAKDLKEILMALKFNKPPPNITPEMLFAKMETKLKDTITKEGDNLVGKPLYNKALTDKDWKQLEDTYTEMYEDYRLRRETLVTRLECTIQSFEWSDRLRSKKDVIQSVYRPKREALQMKPNVKLSDFLAARTSLLLVEKTSSANVRKNTQSDVNKVIMGQVPDRGGRPNEAQPPPPEMPSWQQRSTNQVMSINPTHHLVTIKPIQPINQPPNLPPVPTDLPLAASSKDTETNPSADVGTAFVQQAQELVRPSPVWILTSPQGSTKNTEASITVADGGQWLLTDAKPSPEVGTSSSQRVHELVRPGPIWVLTFPKKKQNNKNSQDSTNKNLERQKVDDGGQSLLTEAKPSAEVGTSSSQPAQELVLPGPIWTLTSPKKKQNKNSQDSTNKTRKRQKVDDGGQSLLTEAKPSAEVGTSSSQPAQELVRPGPVWTLTSPKKKQNNKNSQDSTNKTRKRQKVDDGGQSLLTEAKPSAELGTSSSQPAQELVRPGPVWTLTSPKKKQNNKNSQDSTNKTRKRQKVDDGRQSLLTEAKPSGQQTQELASPLATPAMNEGNQPRRRSKPRRKRPGKWVANRPTPTNQPTQNKRPHDDATSPIDSKRMRTESQTVNCAFKANDLCVAVMTDPFNDLTEKQAMSIKVSLENKLMADLLKPQISHQMSELGYCGKPHFSKGVLKMWCENDLSLQWLQRAVEGTASPITGSKLVIRPQTEIPQRILCGLFVPNIVMDMDKILHYLTVHNKKYVDINSWTLVKTEKQTKVKTPGVYLLFRIPKSDVDILKKQERRLCWMFGSVYVQILEGEAGARGTNLPARPEPTPQTSKRIDNPAEGINVMVDAKAAH